MPEPITTDLTRPIAIVVDDDETSARALADVMGRSGLPALHFTRVAPALATLDRQPSIRIVVSDVAMPELDGLDLAAAIKQRDGQAPHVLFISGRSEMAMPMAALGLGAVDFFPKPVRTAQLVARVRTLLGLHSPTTAEAAQDSWKRRDADLRNRIWLQKERLSLARRRQVMPGLLDPDPAWVMLVELLHAEQQKRPYHVSALCTASGAPTSTALRRLSELVDQGLVQRVADGADARRSWVSLTEKGQGVLRACMDGGEPELSGNGTGRQGAAGGD